MRSICTQVMINNGFSANTFTVEGATITYNDDMIVENDLNISKCNLTLEGKLTVNFGKSLKALIVLVTSSSSQGISNDGTLTAPNIYYCQELINGTQTRSCD